MYIYEAELFDLIKALLRKWYLFILSAAVACVLGFFYSVTNAKVTYTITGNLQVSSDVLSRSDTEHILESTTYLARRTVEKSELTAYTATYVKTVSTAYVSSDGQGVEVMIHDSKEENLGKLVSSYIDSIVEEMRAADPEIEVLSVSVNPVTREEVHPGKGKSMVLGMFLGIFACACGLAAYYLLQEKVLGSNMAEKITETDELAAITGARYENLKKVDDSLKLHRPEGNSVAFVTVREGADSDIPWQFAIQLAQQGYKVAFCDMTNSQQQKEETSGVKTIRRAELIGDTGEQEDIRKRLSEMTSGCDRTVISVNSLLSDNCSQQLATMADSTVCLVRRDKENTAELRQIKDKLSFINADNAGFIWINEKRGKQK